MKNLLIIFLFIGSVASAQTRRNVPLYDLDDRGMKNSGWHFSPGLTYMIPSQSSKRIMNEGSVFENEIKPKGRLGLYAEVGRFHFLRNLYFLDHLDYGIAYKKLSGKQTSTPICEDCDVAELNSLYKDNFASVYVNFSNIYQISDYNFIQNGFGINADYRFNLNTESDVDLSQIPVEQYAPKPLEVQLHYKLSFGMKAEKGVYLLPSIEIPLLNVSPFEKWRSTLIYFDSGYRPIIFSLKLMFQSKRKPEDCKGTNTGKKGHKLWGNDMKG